MFLPCSPSQVSKAAPSSIASFGMQLLTRQQHPWNWNFILRTAGAELQQLSGHKSRLFSRAVNLGQGTHGLGADSHSPQRFPTPQSTQHRSRSKWESGLGISAPGFLWQLKRTCTNLQRKWLYNFTIDSLEWWRPYGVLRTHHTAPAFLKMPWVLQHCFCYQWALNGAVTVEGRVSLTLLLSYRSSLTLISEKHGDGF